MQPRSARFRFIQCALALCAALPLNAIPAAFRSAALPGIDALDTASLKSIASWLKASGKDGFLAAEVADAAGIPRNLAEEVLEARQRGFRSGGVLRIAQVSSDEKRDFLLFMVQRPEGEVLFFLSSVKDGLKKAFVSIPGQGAVVPLGAGDARSAFQGEISYWEARIAGI
jgi:hypothetical protein